MIKMVIPPKYRPRKIAGLLKDFFNKRGYVVSVRCDESTVTINKQADNLPFLSSVDNYIIMGRTSARTQRLKRNFLSTNKPTEEQFSKFYSLLEGLAEDLELEEPVKFEDRLLISNNKLNKTLIKALASGRRFPKSNEETKDVRQKWA